MVSGHVLPNDRVFPSLLLLGALATVIAARIFVFATGITQVYFYGYKLHHFYYGIIMVIAAWFALVVSDVLKISFYDRFLSFAIGAGLGLIADEITLLANFNHYTLGDYYNPINYLSDSILLAVLFIIAYMKVPDTYMDEADI